MVSLPTAAEHWFLFTEWCSDALADANAEESGGAIVGVRREIDCWSGRESLAS